MRVLGWGDGPAIGEHDHFGHESAEQNQDETLIEDSTTALRKCSAGQRLSLIHAAEAAIVVAGTRSTAGSMLERGAQRLRLSLMRRAQSHHRETPEPVVSDPNPPVLNSFVRPAETMPTRTA